MKKSNYKVCIVGVGFVGLTLGVALYRSNMLVYGVDSNLKLIEELSAGRTHILEDGINDLLQEGVNSGKLKFLHSDGDLSEISECNVFVITVGTPLLGKEINLSYLQAALEEIVDLINDEALVILRSTTLIGTAEEMVKPILLSKSKHIRLAMCPERTVEGNALKEITGLPQIIGADDEPSFRAAEDFFNELGVEIVRVSSLRAAELTKLINNTYRDLMFGFANEIALLSQKLKVSAKEVIEAANHNYPRAQIALPGPSGGPCLEKDPWILVESGKTLGIELLISKSARVVNEASVIDFVGANFDSTRQQTVAILGLSFKGKPTTLDARGSYAPKISNFLEALPNKSLVRGYEPAGKFPEAIKGINQERSLDEALRGASTLIILTNSASFVGIENLVNELAAPDCTILDFWGAIKADRLGSSMRYFSWI
jgi:UDP-N-acetyl-D-mannosaminuronic acid dehydrogenase